MSGLIRKQERRLKPETQFNLDYLSFFKINFSIQTETSGFFKINGLIVDEVKHGLCDSIGNSELKNVE